MHCYQARVYPPRYSFFYNEANDVMGGKCDLCLLMRGKFLMGGLAAVKNEERENEGGGREKSCTS